MTRPEVRTLRDAAPLAALAHPFRSRIMDALKVDGPSTASMLAARTGQAVGNASHHLKVLAAAGLVEEAPELARDRRERWWRLVSAATRWSRQELTDPAAVDAALRPRRWRAPPGGRGCATGWPTRTPTRRGTTSRTRPPNWMRLTPDELQRAVGRGGRLLRRWADRPVPDDGGHREPVYVFSRGFPSQP